MNNHKKELDILEKLDFLETVLDSDNLQEHVEHFARFKKYSEYYQRILKKDNISPEENQTTEKEPKAKASKLLPKRCLRDLTNPLNLFSDEEFLNRYHFSKQTIVDILEMVRDQLDHSNNRGKPVSPLLQLLMTIRYMCTGSVQSSIDDLHGVSQSTISRIMLRVATVICNSKEKFIIFPSETDTKNVSEHFYELGQFPFVIGCVGSTHAGIKGPGGNLSESYLNENGYHSIKVQIVCDSNLMIRDFSARWPGATHSYKVFEVSDAKHILDQRYQNRNDFNVNGILLGNNQYPLRTYLYTPIENPETPIERKYNEMHTKTYDCVDRCIELWKRRFRFLTNIMQLKEETCLAMICAAAVLHNIAIQHTDILPVNVANMPLDEPVKKKEFKRSFSLDSDPIPDQNAIRMRSHFIENYLNSKHLKRLCSSTDKSKPKKPC